MLAEPAPKHIVQKLAPISTPRTKKAAAAFVKQDCTWCLAITIRNLLRAAADEGDQIVRCVWEMIDGKAVQRIADSDGGPLQIEHERDEKEELRNVTADEIRELIRLKEKARGQTFTDCHWALAREGSRHQCC